MEFSQMIRTIIDLLCEQHEIVEEALLQEILELEIELEEEREREAS
jgi:hypothetical protein